MRAQHWQLLGRCGPITFSRINLTLDQGWLLERKKMAWLYGPFCPKIQNKYHLQNISIQFRTHMKPWLQLMPINFQVHGQQHCMCTCFFSPQSPAPTADSRFDRSHGMHFQVYRIPNGQSRYSSHDSPFPAPQAAWTTESKLKSLDNFWD